jgi:uncharacterized paraquat-inducible protein A
MARRDRLPPSPKQGEVMSDPETIHVTFTCSHCGCVNELTAAHVHTSTVIHCSRCRASIAPLALLRDRPASEPLAVQLRA